MGLALATGDSALQCATCCTRCLQRDDNMEGDILRAGTHITVILEAAFSRLSYEWKSNDSIKKGAARRTELG